MTHARAREPRTDMRAEPLVGAPDEPHVFHTSRLAGTVWCDTCDSPYCDLA